jgi:hypothetical protein
MKYLSILLSFAFVLSMAGGLPGLHGLYGKDFGQAVKGLAQMHPGAVAHHLSMH